MTIDILKRLDFDRRDSGVHAAGGGIVRDIAPDGSACTIVYSRCNGGNVDDIIRNEIALAESCTYTLEWKVYGHDCPANLKERLVALGFTPEPVEQVMVLPLNRQALSTLAVAPHDVQRIEDPERLEEVADISREIGRTHVEQEQRRLARILRENPEQLSIYVAYDGQIPVACGRMHFRERSDFAEHCGARTRTTHRRRGFYTAIVAACLREVFERDRNFVTADALPMSAPILHKRGFQVVTETQPFRYEPLALRDPGNGTTR